MIIGHNERIAWGFTNLGPDVADLYLERLDGDTYELDGAAGPAHTPRGDHRGGRRRPGQITVRSTGRGPLVTDVGADFAAVAEDTRRGIRPARGRLRCRAAVDGADTGHHRRTRSSR